MATRRYTPTELIRHHRQRRVAYVVIAVILGVLSVLADRQGWLLVSGDDMTRYDGQSFVVTRVIDGDTFEVLAPDGDSGTTRVRLWGVDTPELARPDLNRSAEPLADEATRLAERWLGAGPVTLRLEAHRTRDRYQRLLAHAERGTGGSLGEALLSAGLTRADDRWPHRHMERFELLELQARREGRGLWAPGMGE